MTSEPTRVALLITELDVGGAEKCLVRIARGLDPARFAPQVYALGPPPPAGKDALVQSLAAAGMPAHFAGARHAWQLPSAVRRLREWWNDQQPHVVQAFLFHANIAGALATARMPGMRLLLGMRVADPRHWRQRLEGWAARRADRVVCVSRSVSEFSVQRLAVPRDKLVVIPNGVDLPDESAPLDPSLLPEFGIPPGCRTLATVGRLHRQKGLDWLLRLLPEILARFPDCHQLLLGDGPERARLGALATRLGIADRVHLAGWRADAAEILPHCTALLLPSRWEGMPNALLEAMAAGLPVVAARAEGTVEVLGERSDEQTAEFGDAPGFAERLTRLLADPDQAVRLGAANRFRVAEAYSWPAAITAYERLFEAVAGCDSR